MRRLEAIDWLLLGTLLPLCLFGVVMTVVHGRHGDFVRLPWPHDGWLSSAADAQSYPIVRRLDNSAAGYLEVGDRVLGVEGDDFRGASFARYIMRESRASRAGSRMLRFTIDRGGVQFDVHVPLVPGYRSRGVPWWAPLPFVLSAVGTALLLLVRATHWHLARPFYVAVLLIALWFTPYFWVPTMPWAWITTTLLALPVAGALMCWVLCQFVPGVQLWGTWQRAVAWGLALLSAASVAAVCWLPDTELGAVLIQLRDLPTIGFVVAWLVVLTQAYRRAGPLARRQIKWVVWGFYAATVPLAFAAFSARWGGAWLEWRPALMAVGLIALVAGPLGFLVAIAFYEFLDIDRLFSATLSYSALAILGITVLLGLMPTASRATSDALGIDPVSGQLLIAFGLAAVLVPAQRLVRPSIDRVFFPERISLEHGFEQLLAQISSTASMPELATLVGEQLDALLHPTSAILYARNADDFTPLVVRSRTAPPAFAAQSAFIAALQERAAPLAAERWTARRAAALTPFERAALETLDVAVLVPIRRGTALIAFSCLGPKRSGDIYTTTDLAWLGAVASKIGERVLTLDAAAVVEQARAMQEALRRYVPSAVAQRVVGGRDLAAEEREVTVLFVDIRGYTGFSEARRAEEIFGAVNRYTETISGLVQARGGVVVEFHGDGMLAVFGAPDELPMKERAAVQAGRDILTGIATLPPTDGGAGATLSVGVGIATGTAFVGNIQSADRFIWTVIGNTVNLAARLQSLTRDLDAAAAIDDTTFRRAGPICTDFVRHPDLAIRGRSQPETVHALPLRASHPYEQPNLI